MPPKYFEQSFLKNYRDYASRPKNQLKAAGYKPVITYITRNIGAGEMKLFPETKWINDKGEEIVIDPSAIEQAAQYVQQHPKKDASEVDSNYLLLGGLGLTRSLGGILWNGLKTSLPYLSARTWVSKVPYLTTKAATAIDAGIMGSTTGASINDMWQNGPTVGNVLGTTLGLGGLAFEAAPTVTRGIQNFKNRFTSDGWFTIGNKQYRPSMQTLSMGFPAMESRSSIKVVDQASDISKYINKFDVVFKANNGTIRRYPKGNMRGAQIISESEYNKLVKQQGFTSSRTFTPQKDVDNLDFDESYLFEEEINPILENFNRYIGKENIDVYKPVSKNWDELSNDQKILAQNLKNHGIDLDQVDVEDLKTALNLRREDIIGQRPQDRFNIASTVNSGGVNIDAYNKRSIIGDGQFALNRETKDSWFPLMINRFSSADNFNIPYVSEQIYNGAINTSQQFGLKGIESGGMLLSPAQTNKVWNRFYPKRKQISSDGIWETNLGKTTKNPVYLLDETSSNNYPTKALPFDPTIIDKSGKMNIDWNSKNIFKSLLPLTIFGGSTLFNNEKD